ncbi:MAG: histidine phosphatase family protein [Oleispira sp.]|nr:histidine phosphatase family protein [Oleispira sp.]
MKMQPTFIDVMRHGEPEGTCPEGGTILRGSTDHLLTKKGWWQAEQRCQSIISAEKQKKNNAVPWDIIISSPLLRCSDFAQSLVDSCLDKDKLFIQPQWREIHYGDWDGKSTAKIWQEQPEIMEKMWQAPLEFCAPNGEAVIDFSQRIEQAWSDLITEFQGKRILLVCHGGVMRLLLQQLLMMAPEAMNRFAIPYAAMSRFRVDHSISDEGIALNWPTLLTHLGEELDEELDKELNDE